MRYQKKDLPPGGDVGGSDLPDRGVTPSISIGPTTPLHRKGYEDAGRDIMDGIYDQYGPRSPGSTR